MINLIGPNLPSLKVSLRILDFGYLVSVRHNKERYRYNCSIISSKGKETFSVFDEDCEELLGTFTIDIDTSNHLLFPTRDKETEYFLFVNMDKLWPKKDGFYQGPDFSAQTPH